MCPPQIRLPHPKTKSQCHCELLSNPDKTQRSSQQTKGSDVTMPEQEGSLEVDGAAVQPPPPSPPPSSPLSHGSQSCEKTPYYPPQGC